MLPVGLCLSAALRRSVTHERLAEKVQAALLAGSAAHAQQLQAELHNAQKNAQALGVSPDAVPKVQEPRTKPKETASGRSEHRNSLLSHLLEFFSRYYSDGDCICCATRVLKLRQIEPEFLERMFTVEGV